MARAVQYFLLQESRRSCVSMRTSLFPGRAARAEEHRQARKLGARPHAARKARVSLSLSLSKSTVCMRVCARERMSRLRAHAHGAVGGHRSSGRRRVLH